MSKLRFWVRQGNERLFTLSKKYNFPVEVTENNPQFPDISTGYFEDKNELMVRTKNPNFVRGEVLPWDEVRDDRCLRVVVEETELTTKRLCMTQYDWINVRLEKGNHTIDQKEDVERAELFPGKNFVVRAFDTFDFFFASRYKEGYIPRFVLYDLSGQLDESGNISNRTSPRDLPKAIALKRAHKRQ